jgi:hypothetical protein
MAQRQDPHDSGSRGARRSPPPPRRRTPPGGGYDRYRRSPPGRYRRSPPRRRGYSYAPFASPLFARVRATICAQKTSASKAAGGTLGRVVCGWPQCVNHTRVYLTTKQCHKCAYPSIKIPESGFESNCWQPMDLGSETRACQRPGCHASASRTCSDQYIHVPQLVRCDKHLLYLSRAAATCVRNMPSACHIATDRQAAHSTAQHTSCGCFPVAPTHRPCSSAQQSSGCATPT